MKGEVGGYQIKIFRGVCVLTLHGYLPLPLPP